MKNVLMLTALTMAMVSCATVRHTDATSVSNRAIRQEAKRIAVEESVLSGKYLIKMDRLSAGRGVNVSLSPEFNYFILDDGSVRMKLGYVGRQYDFRGIAAINMSGKPESYEIIKDNKKGRYDIKIKVSQAGEPFTIYLSIHDNASATVTVTNPRIETIRYSGRLLI